MIMNKNTNRTGLKIPTPKIKLNDNIYMQHYGQHRNIVTCCKAGDVEPRHDLNQYLFL